ncbi:MAG: hypothetical protein ACHQCI_02710 [Solirubrobacterales bacterium]|jgi:hypothetical protein
MAFFELSSAALAALLFGVVIGTTLLGGFVGRRLRHLSDDLKEPFAVLQGALLGIVGLVLAFGLSLAVSRYENRREAVVDEANTIGTTYLRSQTLEEPMRSLSIRDLRLYVNHAIGLTDSVPGSAEADAAVAEGEELERGLWRTAGEALDRAPVDSAPRLYVETLNEMIDQRATRIAGLSNRVPDAVLLLEVLGAAVALGLLATYLAILGRGVAPALIASVLVSFLLLVTFDLDRPHRGLIKVPDTALVSERESMELPPAARGPG